MVSSILPKNKRWDDFVYWKLSQRSFFGRIEDTIICFRDCQTFKTKWRPKIIYRSPHSNQWYTYILKYVDKFIWKRPSTLIRFYWIFAGRNREGESSSKAAQILQRKWCSFETRDPIVFTDLYEPTLSVQSALHTYLNRKWSKIK